MYQDKIKAKVDAMISESGTMSRHDKFNLRMKITKEMWENEDKGVKAMVNEEVTKLTSLKLAKHQGERTPEEMAEYVCPINIEHLITDLVTGQSSSYQILSALSFVRCWRQPGGHLPCYLVVWTHMMPRVTSMLPGTTMIISSLLPGHLKLTLCDVAIMPARQRWVTNSQLHMGTLNRPLLRHSPTS